MQNTRESRTRLGGVWAACALVALMATAPANAGLMTFDIGFTADTFQIGSGSNLAPVDPVIGSVTLTFDPTVAVTNSTANISLNSLNIALSSPIAFSYDPTLSGGFLSIGGANAGAGTIIFSPSTNDFWFFIDNFTTTQTFLQVGYTQTSVSNNNLFFTLNRTGTASVVTVAAVPEPSGLALCGLGIAGLAGVGVVRTRRGRSGRA